MALETLKARYAELCAQRDATNKVVEPLQKQLEQANAKAEAARLEAEGLAKQISDVRGGQNWLDLKKEIATLANALSGKLK